MNPAKAENLLGEATHLHFEDEHADLMRMKAIHAIIAGHPVLEDQILLNNNKNTKETTIATQITVTKLMTGKLNA